MDDDPFFKFELNEGHYICLSPLTKQTLDDLDVDGLGDDFGYFLYETQGSRTSARCMEVIAKCATIEAAMRLLELYRLTPLHLAAPPSTSSQIIDV